jgi:UDP-glucose-4-epimerase GalE
MMKRVLVTGGAGYIGSHTCKLLAKKGYEPVCYDNLSTGHREFVKWGPLVEGDIRDTEKLNQVFNEHRPFAVMHFAASASVAESMTEPLKYYSNNVAGTLLLLNAMQAFSIGKLVFSSSCATYGKPDVATISEDCPQSPINPYGQSKLMVEHILRDLANVGKIKHVCLRYFNAAGADKDGEIGEWHEPETHLVPLAIKAGLRNQPLQIFGTDYATGDGTAVRDYIHVEDLAAAHWLSLEHLLAGKPSEYLNLGTGHGHSILEVVSGLARLGLNVQTRVEARRPGDPARLVADAAKAKRVLQWTPRYENLGDILESSLTWHRRRGNL